MATRACIVASFLALLTAPSMLAAQIDSVRPTRPGRLPTDSPAVGPGHASISGEVRARGVGLAVPAAEVTVLGPDGRVEAHKQSDSRGGFVFKDLSAGMYTIRAEAPGFVRAVQRQVMVRGDQTANVTLSLDPQPLTIPKLQVEARRRDKAFIQHQIGMNVNSINPSHIVIGSRLQKLGRSSIDFVNLLRKLAIPGMVVDRNRSGRGYCVQIGGVVGDMGQPLCAKIFLDGLPVGDMSTLDNDVTDITGVVLLDADQAGVLYGTGAEGGVLLVYTREGMGLRPKQERQ